MVYQVRPRIWPDLHLNITKDSHGSPNVHANVMEDSRRLWFGRAVNVSTVETCLPIRELYSLVLTAIETRTILK